MARSRLYTIYDRVAEQAGPIFSAPNDGVAARHYRALLQQVSPVDMDAYWLMFVGYFDDAAVSIEAEPEGIKVEVALPQLQLQGLLPGGEGAVGVKLHG